MKAAYADPPYLGCGKRYYNDATYDDLEAHRELIEGLGRYDAWAYSLNSTTLQSILPLCPTTVCIGAWVKPFCSFKPNVNPAYAWEPVIFSGGRKRERYEPTVRDYVAANITLKKGLTGAKPLEFSFWVFEMLGLEPTDEFIDIFPGSGMVGRAWTHFSQRVGMPQTALFTV